MRQKQPEGQPGARKVYSANWQADRSRGFLQKKTTNTQVRERGRERDFEKLHMVLKTLYNEKDILLLRRAPLHNRYANSQGCKP